MNTWKCTMKFKTVLSCISEYRLVVYNNHSPPIFKTDVTIGWVNMRDSQLLRTRVRRLAKVILIVRSTSVIGAASTISNGASIPKSKWPSICAVKSMWARFARGPATDITAKRTPETQYTVRDRGHCLWCRLEIITAKIYRINANIKAVLKVAEVLSLLLGSS